MVGTTRVGLLAGASTLMLATVSVADTPTTEVQELQAQVEALQAQVSRLGGDNWLTEQRADEIRSLVHDVLADADTRASLLQGMSGGYNDGFVLGSSDGNFSLKINGQLQTRFVWNNQDESPGSGIDEDRWGFENTRTKLVFSGNIGGQDWGYKVEGNFGRSGGAFGLQDAYITYQMDNGWKVAMGQRKLPFNREFLVHSSDQLAIERSNVSYLYNGGRTQGIWFDYMSDQFGLTVGFNDGLGGINSVWSTFDTEYALTGRVEYLASGTWDQFADFTSPQGSEQGLMIGGAVHWQDGESGTTATEVETLALTADVSFENDGWGAFAAINYSSLDFATGPDLDTIGFVVQGSYYLQPDLEGFVRYEWNDFDVTGVEELSLITFGVNKYYSDHVKASLDVGIGIDEISAASNITGARVDPSMDDGQLIVRTQLQLVF